MKTITKICSAMSLTLLSSVAYAEGSITYASWGGAFQAAEREAFFNPAEKALGITIKEDSLSGLGDLRAQVQSGSPAWDIAELGSDACALAAKEGLAEPLDFNVISTQGVNDELVTSHSVGLLYFGTVIGWSTEKYGDNGPSNWADFYDVDKFPGSRAMRSNPKAMLETAMFASGRSADEIYPIDEDLAFSMLEKLRPNVDVWWKSGAQSAQLIKDGEVDMIAIWNGRIEAAIADGAEAQFTFNQNILDYDCLVVPKGAKNPELAMKVINEMLKAENQATLPLHINYGPANSDAFAVPGVITEEIANGLPSSPAYADSAAVISLNWWVDRLKSVTERYSLMIQQ